jgi:uncharacterized protein YuzE
MELKNDSDPSAPYPVRVTFDPSVDAAYVRLANSRPGEATVQVSVEGVPNVSDILLDFNSDGQLLGIEIIGARAVLSADLLALADSLPPPEA